MYIRHFFSFSQCFLSYKIITLVSKNGNKKPPDFFIKVNKIASKYLQKNELQFFFL